MLSSKMQEALNGQLNAELYSSYLYLAMAAYFEAADFPGFANWMRVQAQEELLHGMKFYDFIGERDGRVTLAAIEAPPAEWDSPQAAFEHVVEHERKVTGLINDLVELAGKEKDYATHNFLQWFVGEQVEEESSARAVLQQVKLAGDTGGGLFLVDKELAARVFTPPAAPAE
ncbi:MAG: ferritin [Candidatus Coatesbacteria bacterium]|nr:MAG: ferritin [Candidatus Coatesbacteria bacterium]